MATIRTQIASLTFLSSNAHFDNSPVEGFLGCGLIGAANQVVNGKVYPHGLNFGYFLPDSGSSRNSGMHRYEISLLKLAPGFRNVKYDVEDLPNSIAIGSPLTEHFLLSVLLNLVSVPATANSADAFNTVPEHFCQNKTHGAVTFKGNCACAVTIHYETLPNSRFKPKVFHYVGDFRPTRDSAAEAMDHFMIPMLLPDQTIVWYAFPNQGTNPLGDVISNLLSDPDISIEDRMEFDDELGIKIFREIKYPSRTASGQTNIQEKQVLDESLVIA